jgi:hypothetical protein
MLLPPSKKKLKIASKKPERLKISLSGCNIERPTVKESLTVQEVPMRMVSLNVSLPKADRMALLQLALQHNVSISLLIRRAIRLLLLDLEEQKTGPFMPE